MVANGVCVYRLQVTVRNDGLAKAQVAVRNDKAVAATTNARKLQVPAPFHPPPSQTHTHPHP